METASTKKTIANGQLRNFRKTRGDFSSQMLATQLAVE